MSIFNHQFSHRHVQFEHVVLYFIRVRVPTDNGDKVGQALDSRPATVRKSSAVDRIFFELPHTLALLEPTIVFAIPTLEGAQVTQHQKQTD